MNILSKQQKSSNNVKNIISKFKKGALFGVLVGICVALAIANVQAWLPANNPVSVADGDHLTGALLNDHVNKLIELNNRPTFITPVEIKSGNGAINFTAYDASGSVPAGARAVILEAEASMNGPDGGDINAHIRIRKDAASSSYVLLRGAAAGGGDNISWSGQGIFSVTDNRNFQYTVEAPGFNQGWVIRLIGYF